jgi:hypothetical protein
VFLVINGLSDHDAQYLIINNVGNCRKNKSELINRSIISESGILTFKEMLSTESWDSVFELKYKSSYSDLREGNVKVGNQNVATACNTYYLSSVNKLVGQSFSNACFFTIS